MAYIEVDIDIEDYLDEISDEYLARELEDRGFKIYGRSEDEEEIKSIIIDYINSNSRIPISSAFSNEEILNRLKEFL